MINRRTFLLALAALAACGKPPRAPFRVGINPWVGYDPLVLARERGLLDPGEVQIVELASNSECARALRNGLLEAATQTLDEALRLADDGVPIRLVALLDVSNGADAVLARNAIENPRQLAGKRIGLEKTALGALVLDRLLRAGDLRADQVSVVHVEAAQHAAQLINGHLDAVITFEPIKSQLLAKGCRVIFDSARMPNEIIDTLVVHADVDAHRVKMLLTAWRNGRLALLADPRASATLLSRESGLTADEYLATLNGLRFLTLSESSGHLADGAVQLAREANAVVTALRRLDLIRKNPDWPALVYPDLQQITAEVEA